jgi:hypothetical protein
MVAIFLPACGGGGCSWWNIGRGAWSGCLVVVRPVVGLEAVGWLGFRWGHVIGF